MQKRYRDPLIKGFTQAIPASFAGFQKVKTVSFAPEFFKGEHVFLAGVDSKLRLFISISTDPKMETRFFIHIGWADADCGPVPAQDDEAYRANSEAHLVPLENVKFGIINLQVFEGSQFQLGYKVPSPYDAIDASRDKYVNTHGLKSLLTRSYEQFLNQCLSEADYKNSLLTDEEVKAASLEAVEKSIDLIKVFGLPFFERVREAKIKKMLSQ